MTIPSEKLATVDANRLYERYGGMLGRKAARHARIGKWVGTAAGGVAGGGLGAAVTRRKQPGETKEQHSTRRAENVTRGAIVGGLLGRRFGHNVGGGLAIQKGREMAERHAKDITAHGSRARANAHRNFWTKIPDAARNKVQGVARHAKGTGNEATNARARLTEMGKKHNFNPEHAIKLSSFHAALLTRV